MNLNDTAKMMNSEDYKERFKAEYYQLEIRIDKLTSTLSLWDAGELTFSATCPYDLFEAQLNSTKVYQHILRERATLEGIEL